MKAKVFKGISLAVICLAIISCVVLAGTMARYQTTFTGEGTVHTASWSFSVNGTTATEAEKNFTFTLTDGNADIYPGSSGTITLTLANAGEVDATVVLESLEASMGEGETGPALTFKINDTEVTDNQQIATVTAGNTTGTTVSIAWEWAYGEDVIDNEFADKDITVTISLLAYQTAPSTQG